MQGVPTKTVIPSEGAIGWADSGLHHTDRARTRRTPTPSLNHLLDPAVNAEANSGLLQGPGVAAAVPLLTPEAAPALYPYDDIDNYLYRTP